MLYLIYRPYTIFFNCPNKNIFTAKGKKKFCANINPGSDMALSDHVSLACFNLE